MVHHPTSRCYALKDKIQALIEAGVLTLKSEQKKVSTNMVSFKFGSLPKMTVQGRLTPIPNGEMKVTHPSSVEKKSKGLIPITLKSGEVMWVHPNIVKDEQYESERPKCKGKSCNMISFSLGDDNGILANPITDSEEEHIVLVVQPVVAEPTGTGSGKTYLKQYNQTSGEVQQP